MFSNTKFFGTRALPFHLFFTSTVLGLTLERSVPQPAPEVASTHGSNPFNQLLQRIGASRTSSQPSQTTVHVEQPRVQVENSVPQPAPRSQVLNHEVAPTLTDEEQQFLREIGLENCPVLSRTTCCVQEPRIEEPVLLDSATNTQEESRIGNHVVDVDVGSSFSIQCDSCRKLCGSFLESKTVKYLSMFSPIIFLYVSYTGWLTGGIRGSLGLTIATVIFGVIAFFQVAAWLVYGYSNILIKYDQCESSMDEFHESVDGFSAQVYLVFIIIPLFLFFTAFVGLSVDFLLSPLDRPAHGLENAVVGIGVFMFVNLAAFKLGKCGPVCPCLELRALSDQEREYFAITLEDDERLTSKERKKLREYRSEDVRRFNSMTPEERARLRSSTNLRTLAERTEARQLILNERTCDRYKYLWLGIINLSVYWIVTLYLEGFEILAIITGIFAVLIVVSGSCVWDLATHSWREDQDENQNNLTHGDVDVELQEIPRQQ